MKTQFSKLKSVLQAALVLALLLSGPSLFAQSENKSDISPDMLEKIDQVNAQLITAMEKGDVSKIMELYTDDAMVIIPGGKSLRGKKEISEYFSSLKNMRNVKMSVFDAGGSGKIIYQVGKATYTTNIDGKDTEETTDFVMVLKRQPDWDYKISVNSTN
jgi:uncharacterized protein (TIGR02246 family)